MNDTYETIITRDILPVPSRLLQSLPAAPSDVPTEAAAPERPFGLGDDLAATQDE